MKKLFSRKIIKILWILILCGVLILVGLLVLPIYKLKTATVELKGQPTEESLVNWYNSYNQSGLASGAYLSLPDALLEYNQNTQVFRKINILNFPELSVVLNSLTTETAEIEDELIPDNNLIFGQRLILNEGIALEHEVAELYLPESSTKIVAEQSVVKNPESRKVLVGNADRVTVLAKISDYLDSTFNSLEVIENADETEIAEPATRFELEKIVFVTGEDGQVASAAMLDKSCKTHLTIPVIYDTGRREYRVQNSLYVDCPDTKESIVLDCVNCSLAPVDKYTALPSEYIPETVAITLPGGGRATPEANQALLKMAEGIYAKGLTIYISSAYRSYFEQQNTFNAWLQREIGKGNGFEQAQSNANNFSAFAGHSEHQLGTTFDVRCVGCNAFVQTTTPLYEYLEQHAHEFGFVISYPEGKENLTGYIYEPWHIRYIGVPLATELFNRGYMSNENGEYLAGFLREKGMY